MMMCLGCVVLISLISAASEVDFPSPVGPVNRTRPLLYLENWLRASGRLSSEIDCIAEGITRYDAARAPFSK